jgi:ABC-type transport system involved in multi-copper enzyme maturation permease subunit
MSALAGAMTTRTSVAAVIAGREARAAMRGIGGYVALTVALLAAAWLLLVDVRALETAGILVRADPFRGPLAVSMLVVALFLGISAAISTARDRESGTLEVLFYGPVDEISYILGKAGGLLLAYVAALPIIAASFALLAYVTGFALTPIILASLLLSIIPAAEVIAFGILLAVGTDRVRNAVLLFVAAAALLVGITLAYRMVLLVPIDSAASPVLPLRDALAALDLGIRFVSPFAYLEQVVDGAVRGAWRSVLIGLAGGVAYFAVIVVLAAFWLRRRGVYRRGE